MNKYKDSIKKIIDFAGKNADIEAIIMIGSQCRKIKQADKYSDLDLVIFTDNPDKYIDVENWLNNFGGKVVCTFVEITIGGFKERRVLYTDNRDIDFTIIPSSLIFSDEFFTNSIILNVCNKGYKILYDKSNIISKKLKKNLKGYNDKFILKPEKEMNNLVSDFNYHIIWAAKKLKRKELWISINCINGYLGNLLLQMIKYYTVLYNKNNTIWHYGRFLEDYIPDKFKKRLRNCFCRYDEKEAEHSIVSLFEFFNEITKNVYQKAGYKINNNQFLEVQRLLNLIN
jgi:aminoglycoside 6-adenylyltransferase